MPVEIQITQTPEAITKKVFDHLSETNAEVPIELVHREISALWGQVNSPSLRQFIAPLAENTLRRNPPPQDKT